MSAQTIASSFISNHLSIDPSASTSRVTIRERLIETNGSEAGRNALYSMIEGLQEVRFVNGVYYGIRLKTQINMSDSLDDMIDDLSVKRRVLKATKRQKKVDGIKIEPGTESKPATKPKAKPTKRSFTETEVVELASKIATNIISNTLGQMLPQVIPKRTSRLADVEIIDEIAHRTNSRKPSNVFQPLVPQRSERPKRRRGFNMTSITMVLNEIATEDILDEEGNLIGYAGDDSSPDLDDGVEIKQEIIDDALSGRIAMIDLVN